MRKLILLLAVVAISSTSAFAKPRKAKVVQTHPNCFILSNGVRQCTPAQVLFYPVVLAGDISMGIINGVTYPFR